jgi:hypothetical protein
MEDNKYLTYFLLLFIVCFYNYIRDACWLHKSEYILKTPRLDCSKGESTWGPREVKMSPVHGHCSPIYRDTMTYIHLRMKLHSCPYLLYTWSIEHIEWILVLFFTSLSYGDLSRPTLSRLVGHISFLATICSPTRLGQLNIESDN